MDLLEYIKMSYLRPNRAVLQGLGASNDLIEYLLETPNNMNINVIHSLTGQSSSSGVVLYDGLGQTQYNSEINITQVVAQVDTASQTLYNVKEGTTFKVEMDGESYDFTIVQMIEIGKAGFILATSYIDDGVVPPEFPIFALQLQIENNYILGTYILGVEGTIDKETVNIKITQTSDYEIEPEVITGPYHLTVDFNGGTYGENHLTTLTLDTDYYSNDIVDLNEILLSLKSNINSPETDGNIPQEPSGCSLQHVGQSIQYLKMNDNKTVYILYGVSIADGPML